MKLLVAIKQKPIVLFLFFLFMLFIFILYHVVFIVVKDCHKIVCIFSKIVLHINFINSYGKEGKTSEIQMLGMYRKLFYPLPHDMKTFLPYNLLKKMSVRVRLGKRKQIYGSFRSQNKHLVKTSSFFPD